MVHEKNMRRVLFGGDLYEQNRQSIQTSDMSFLFSKTNSLDESVARKLMEGGVDGGNSSSHKTTESEETASEKSSEESEGTESEEESSEGSQGTSSFEGSQETQNGGRKKPVKRSSYRDKMLVLESTPPNVLYDSMEISYDSDSKEYNVSVRRSPNCSKSEKGHANSVENVMERIRAIYETLGKKCKPSVSELFTTDDSNLSVQYPYLSDKSLSEEYIDEGYKRDAKDSDAYRKTYKELIFIL
jgi:hypothetical protein